MYANSMTPRPPGDRGRAVRRRPNANTAGARKAEVASPLTTRKTSATTGSPSLMKLFQIAVSVSDRPISDGVNPQERYIPMVIPLAMNPPPGTVLATVVDDWLFTAA